MKRKSGRCTVRQKNEQAIRKMRKRQKDELVVRNMYRQAERLTGSQEDVSGRQKDEKGVRKMYRQA